MCTLLIVNVKAACPERTTFEPRAYRSSASMPDATTVEPSARQSVPILLHSNRGEAGTDDDGEAVTIAADGYSARFRSPTFFCSFMIQFTPLCKIHHHTRHSLSSHSSRLQSFQTPATPVSSSAHSAHRIR